MARGAFVFAQFIRLLSKPVFIRIVKKYKGDYRTRHFKCWDQLCLVPAYIPIFIPV